MQKQAKDSIAIGSDQLFPVGQSVVVVDVLYYSFLNITSFLIFTFLFSSLDVMSHDADPD